MTFKNRGCTVHAMTSPNTQLSATWQGFGRAKCCHVSKWRTVPWHNDISAAAAGGGGLWRQASGCRVASQSLRVRRNGVSTVFIVVGGNDTTGRRPPTSVFLRKVGSFIRRGRSTSIGSITGSLVGAAAAGEMGG